MKTVGRPGGVLRYLGGVMRRLRLGGVLEREGSLRLLARRWDLEREGSLRLLARRWDLDLDEELDVEGARRRRGEAGTFRPRSRAALRDGGGGGGGAVPEEEDDFKVW
jgi:hypothetical protein